MESEDQEGANEEAILPASMCPPAHGQDGDSCGSFVLLDYTAYFADRSYATTASCKMRDGKGFIHVTFYAAAPPLVSYFCVHFTGGLKLSHFATEPEIVDSEGGIVLLRAPLGDQYHSLDHDISEYFIYHVGAMGEDPSLTQLPHPRPYELLDHQTSIMRHCANDYHDCSHCKYTIASLIPHMGKSYHLVLFRSDAMACSRQTILLAVKNARPHASTSMTITIGGKRGTMGWVDLWRGILFCDVLTADGQHTLRFVPLPPPHVEDKVFDRISRDIAVVNGVIKYIGLQVRVVPGSSFGCGAYTLDGWSPAQWSMQITDTLSKKFKLDYVLDASDIPDTLKLKVDAGTAQPTLKTLHIGQPILSLQDDDIVYLLAKVDHRDEDCNGWVLAVDTKSKKIRGVSEFGVQRTLGLSLVYIASRISEYLKVTPGNHIIASYS
ncbi:hypothetical protein CFC21_036173 [Triticum aestivum]|uniref:DUF1618 domain-containing protein n=2 Tax=Triticum aestivum TaxID=4565 RepID=A0A9R1JNL5_WHEAT|nr:hypothetical protein CFC21_036173 [Triticum aestivum]